MIASGLMPRSPVWLRKIPSTVSGSQGSRRGFAPAVRFAFPLGARLNTTLRARPCQELFSESFSRPSRGPRGAPPSGLRPFAAAHRRGRFSLLYISKEIGTRLRARPPSARAILSATAPCRFSMSEGFHHFDIEEAKARPPIRMLKHFHRVRSYTCMPKRPWPRS